jgi:hypothetical protein
VFVYVCGEREYVACWILFMNLQGKGYGNMDGRKFSRSAKNNEPRMHLKKKEREIMEENDNVSELNEVANFFEEQESVAYQIRANFKSEVAQGQLVCIPNELKQRVKLNKIG